MFSPQHYLFFVFLILSGVEGGLRALKYDTECPFLTDREYAERMKQGRCPIRVEEETT